MKSEVLPIPAHASRQEATRCTGGVLLIERSLDTPIVRYIEFPPVAVIKTGLLGARGVTQTKPPIRIKLNLATTLPADLRRHQPRDQEPKENNLSEPKGQIVVYNTRR